MIVVSLTPIVSMVSLLNSFQKSWSLQVFGKYTEREGVHLDAGRNLDTMFQVFYSMHKFEEGLWSRYRLVMTDGLQEKEGWGYSSHESGVNDICLRLGLVVCVDLIIFVSYQKQW